MAVSTTGNDDELKAEINVTPLVDVVLVLLVVFLVVTPFLEQEVPIQLPVTEHGRVADASAQVTLSLAADERVLLNGVEVPPDDLVPRLTEIYAARADKTIFLEADRALTHGRIVDLMDDARAAGVVQIGVVTRKASPAEAAPDAPPGLPPEVALPEAAHPLDAGGAPDDRTNADDSARNSSR